MAFWFSGADSTLDPRPMSARYGRRPAEQSLAATAAAAGSRCRSAGLSHKDYRTRGIAAGVCGSGGPHLTNNGQVVLNNSYRADGSCAADGSVISQRFNTPNRSLAQQRGYEENPITGRPMTHGGAEDPKTVERARQDAAASAEKSGRRPDYNMLAAGPTIILPTHNKDEHELFHGCHKTHTAPIVHDGSKRHRRSEYVTTCRRGDYPQKQSNGAPFDSDLVRPETVPTPRFQKMKVDPPTGRRLITDEDNFIIKTSRRPPPGAWCNETDTEGFQVLYSTNPARGRDAQNGLKMRGMISGKGMSRMYPTTEERRNQREQMIMEERRAKCERAFAEEQWRMDHRKTLDLDERRPLRSAGLCSPRKELSEPYALGLPAPQQATVGKSVSKFIPKWRR